MRGFFHLSACAFCHVRSLPAYMHVRLGRPDALHARRQLLGSGVTLHMACPGFVDTPMIREAQAAAVLRPAHPPHTPGYTRQLHSLLPVACLPRPCGPPLLRCMHGPLLISIVSLKRLH